MSGVRPNRSIGALQVGLLRYDRNTIPANGGMAVVDGQGQITVASEVSIDKITASSVVNTPVINAGTATLTTANISTLNASNITITGATSFEQISVSGNADISGALDVSSATVRGALLTDTLEVNGISLFTDGVTIDGPLTVDVNELVTVGKIIATEIAATKMDVSGLKVGNNVDISGNFTAEETATFRGPVTFQETIDVSGAADFRSEVTFHNNIIIVGSITDADITDADFIRMDRGFMTNLRVGDKTMGPFASGIVLDVSGGAQVRGGVTVTSGSLVVQGGGVSMGGAATVGNRLNVTGGGASIAGGVTVASGVTVTSGSLVVQGGGVSMSGAATVGNLLNVVAGGASIAGGVTVASGVTVTSGSLVVQSGGVSMSGAATVGNLLNVVAGGASIAGGATIVGDMDISGGLTVVTNKKATIRNPSTTGPTSTPILNLDASGHEIMFIGNMSGGAYNSLAKAGDKGIIFRDRTSTPASSGNLVIAPHSNSIGGIRITADSKVGVNKQLPDVELDVNGAIQASGTLTVGGGATVTGTAIFRDGNVGISSTVSPGVSLQVDVGSRNALSGIAARSIDVNTIIGAYSDIDGNNYGSIQTTKGGAITGAATPGTTVWGVQIQPLGGPTEIGINKKQRIIVSPTGTYTKTDSGMAMFSANDITNNPIISVIDANVNRVDINGSLKLLRNGGTGGNGDPPAIYWGNDGLPNTGINHPADDQISVITGGSTQMHVTTAGVTVAGIAKANRIEVGNNGTSTAASIYWSNSGDNDTGINHPADGQIELVANTEQMLHTTTAGVTINKFLSVKSAAGPSNNSVLGLSSAGGNYVDILTNAPLDAYNGLTEAGDKMLLFSNGSAGTGNMVIGPWTTGADAGLRITPSGVTVGGNLNVTGSMFGVGSSPIGSITMFGGGTAPNGWLMCDGTEYNRGTYASLFAVIGTTFGNGNGSTTFNVPDLRGRSPLGAGHNGSLYTNRILGESGGAETHTLTVNEMPKHSHEVKYFNDVGTAHPNTLQNFSSGSDYVSAPFVSEAGGDQPHNNMHPFLNVYFIIRAF
jgi:microcystin-dependent protein